MDELILSRLAPGLYGTVAATEPAGLAFMPETDRGLASLALSGDITKEGRWLAWSNGPLLPVLSQVIPLLRDGDYRIVFSRGPFAGTVLRADKSIGLIPNNNNFSARLRPDFPDIGALQINDLPRIETTVSRLEVRSDALALVATSGASHFWEQGPSGTGFKELLLEARGSRAGCFAFEIALNYRDLPNYGLQTVVTAQAASFGGIEVQRDARPIFAVDDQPEGTNLHVTVIFDPLNGGDPERWQVLPRSGTRMRSRFKGVHGHDVMLRVPDPGAATLPPRLRLVLNRSAMSSEDAVSVYRAAMMPEGSFDIEMTMPGQSDAVKTWRTGLAVGDTPHEYLLLDPIEADAPPRMTFRLNKSHVATPLSDIAEDGQLVGAARPYEDVTLWARIERPARTAEPAPFVTEAKALRQIEMRAPSFRKGAIQLRQADPRRLRGVELDKEAGYVPILPAPDVDATSGDIPAQLSSARRLAALTARQSSPGPFAPESGARSLPPMKPETRVTTAGFEIREDIQNNVREIIFARGAWDSTIEGRVSVVGDPDPLDPDVPGLIPAPLSAAILRNQLFMALDPAKLDTMTEPGFKIWGQIAVAGWGFKISRAEDRAERTTTTGPSEDDLILFKGYEGLSILQLAQEINLKHWSGKSYVGDPKVAARRIRQLHTQITQDEKLKKDPRYDALRTALTDKDWNGVLILDMRIDPSNLPGQIKALMSGVDRNKFLADHLGFPVQRLSDGARPPQAKPFAAVSYESPPFSPPDNGEYAFNVQKLAVGFAGGRITAFSCALELRLGGVFKDTQFTLKKDGTDVETNIVTLEGSYERRVEDGVSVEVYKFLTKDDFEIEMGHDFPLLKKVTITELGYAAEVSRIKGPNGNEFDKVNGAFLIDGDIDFKPLDLDLGGGVFDFIDKKKVRFFDLSIDMDFNIDLAGTVSGLSLDFNAGGLAFDFDISKAFGGGFFSSFPLKWKTFGLLTGDLTLPDIGFTSIAGPNVGGHVPFYFVFDVDLGSFGSLGEALKDFKMELALGFGWESGAPVIDLGIKFPSSPPGSLDIGIQGVIELKAEKYELVQLVYPQSDGTEGKAWGFRGVGVEIVIFGVALPPGDSTSGLYIFADPSNLDAGVGWLISTVTESKSGTVDLRLLTLGQRIDPLPGVGQGAERITTQVVLDQLALTATGGSNPKDKRMPVGDNVGENKAEEITVPAVTYDPTRDWTIAFDVELFDILTLGLAIRDPDLAGLRVKVAELFDIDVLYRKLSEDLGVFSTEVALAENLRHWQFGAAGFTIPVIAFDIYTNSDWGVDIGFPHNKDFSRSFHLNIFPFTGAGGLVFRRVSGPAARLIPSKGELNDGSFVPYSPVTEVQLGARVGLGVAVGGGMFRAGLSLTVYMYLNGAYGRLQVPTGKTPIAKRSYILVEGIVGIMGELYGYVDFGIVRAGVHVTLWVESGVRFETDRALRLHYEVGVRVRVRVVIARVCIWRKCFEISVSFSFGTQVRIEQTIGRDNTSPYQYGSAHLEALKDSGSYVALRESFSSTWDTSVPPTLWGAAGPKVHVTCVLQPDITLAFKADTGEAQPQAVLLLASQLTDPAGQQRSAGPISGPEELVRGLTAWAIHTHVADTDALSAPLLREVAARLAGDDGALENHRAPDRPTAQSISEFFQKAFSIKVRDLQDNGSSEATSGAKGALIPLPSQLQVMLDATSSFALSDFNFVDQDYLDRVDELTKVQLLAEVGEAQSTVPPTVADVLLQEWAALVMRGALGKLADHLDALTAKLPDVDQDLDVQQSLIQLMDWLVAPHDVDTAGKSQLRSHAAEVAMQAGRSLMAGPRIPIPTTGTVPPWIEAAPVGAEDDWFHPLFRLAGMQFPIDPTAGPSIPAGQYGWLSVPDELDFKAPNTDVLRDLAMAAEALEQDAADNDIELFNTHVRRAPLLKSRPRYVRLGGMDLVDRIDGRPVWPLDSLREEGREAVGKINAFARSDTRPNAPLTYEAIEDPNELKNLVPAMILDLSVAPVAETAAAKTAPSGLVGLTIRAMEEAARAVLDQALASGQAAPDVASVRLYVVDGSGSTGNPLESAGGVQPIVVKTNPSREVTAPPATERFRAIERSVVRTSEGADFLELIRQAVIVNTGGFTIFVPEDKLPDLQTVKGDTDPLQAGLRLRIVAELGVPQANNGLADVNDPRLKFGNVLMGADGGWGARTVLAIDMGNELYPLHQPGVLPVLVTRDPAPQDPKEISLLSERFSTASFELRHDGQVILSRDRSIAVQPDVEDRDQTERAAASPETAFNETAPWEYRASMPIGQLTGLTDSPIDAKREAAEGRAKEVDLYALVGTVVETAVHWRDVYGNLWGTEAATSESFVLQYCDRLVGLLGLPFLRFVQSPNTSVSPVEGKLALTLTLSFDRLAVKAAMEDEFDPGQLRLAAATLQRAAAQLRDARATLELAIGAHAKGAVTVLSEAVKIEIVGFLDKMTKEVIIASEGNDPANLSPLELAQAVDLPKGDAPVEFTVDIALCRPPVSDKPELYPVADAREMPDVTTKDEAYAALAPFAKIAQEVPIAIDATAQAVQSAAGSLLVDATRPAKPLDGYLDSLETAVEPSYRVATGRSGRPSGASAAIWLVPRGMTDKITEGTTSLAGRNGVPYAFRPIKNRRVSADFSDSGGYGPIAKPYGAVSQSVRVLDADVDLETRRIIDFLEQLNDPKVIAAAAEKETSDTGPLDAFVANYQIQRRSFAEILVDSQLAAVFEDDENSTALDQALKGRVSDRLSRDLTRFDTTGGFLVYPDDSAPPQPEGAELHGTLVFAKPSDGSHNDGYAPPSPEIQLFALEIGTTAAEDDDRRSTLMLSFPLQLDNILAAPPAGIRLTHLQANKRVNAGDPNNDYRPTAWLKLHDQVAQASGVQPLAGWSAVALNRDPAVIPLRRVPSAPTLMEERFVPRLNPGETHSRLRDLRQWTALHQLNITGMSGQDKLTSTVTYSDGAERSGRNQEAFGSRQEPLWVRLLRFGEEIRGIDVSDVYTGPKAADLRDWLTDRLDALVVPLPARAERAKAAGPQKDVVTVQETGADTDLRMILERLKGVAPKADWLWESGGMDKEFAIPAEGAGAAVYQAGARPPSPIRQLRLRELDAFVQAEATSQHYVDRNREADKRPLREGFVYTTPLVGSAEPIVPVLDYKSEVRLGDPIRTNNGTIDTVSLWQKLREIFQELLGETDRELMTDIMIEYENDVFLGSASPSGSNWREPGGPLIVAVTGFTGNTEQDLDELTGQIVEYLTTWAGNGGPIRDLSNDPIGRLVFDLRVYNATPLSGSETELDDTRVLWIRRGILGFQGQMP